MTHPENDNVPPKGLPRVGDLDHFFELSLDLLTVAGFDGYFKRLNPMWSKLLGWTQEEFFARPSVEFVHPDDRAATLAARSKLKDGIALTGLTNRYLCKDGSHRWLEWRSVSDAKAGLVYAVARDITAQREQEQEQQRVRQRLLSAERMASVGRLAGRMAHELNNPLAVVLANLRAARTDLPQLSGPASVHQELGEMLADCEESAERMRVIVQELNAFARFRQERGRPLELRQVMEQSILMVSHDLHHSARVVQEYEQTPLVTADASSLIEVFANLLSNAAKAFATPNPELNEIRIRTTTDAQGRAVVEVTDNGVGLSAEVQARLLDPLKIVREPGVVVGFGLAICQTLVSEMGGTLTVISQAGAGSTFRVELPGSTGPA